MLLNPNSYENLVRIISSLKVNLEIGRSCQWTVVGCDGPPYCLASRIIEHDPTNYDWISLISGIGHLNMNQVKIFFEKVDKIFLEALGKEASNFESPKTYDFFINCKNNHKTWQTFEVLLHGTTKELIELCFDGTTSYPSVLDFLDWITNTENATLKVVWQLTLGHGLSIYIQRIGDSNNDIFTSDAGRYKFFDLFYAFKYPIYREVGYRDLCNKVIYPNEVYKLLSENITFSSSNNPGKCQGGDFVLAVK